MSLEFWQEKPATVGGMVLVDGCDILDRVERADILAQLPPLEGMDIVELGAGIGRYTSHFVRVARHVIMVDFVEKFIEENRRATDATKSYSSKWFILKIEIKKFLGLV